MPAKRRLAGGIVAGFTPARISGVSCVKSCVTADEAPGRSLVRLRSAASCRTRAASSSGRHRRRRTDVSAGVASPRRKGRLRRRKVPSAAAQRTGVALSASDGSTSRQSPGGITIDHGEILAGPGRSADGVVASLRGAATGVRQA